MFLQEGQLQNIVVKCWIFLFLKTFAPKLEYPGYNAKLCRESNVAKKLGSVTECCSLIDLSPIDPSAFLTPMLEAKRKTKSTGLAVTAFPANQ